jgi:hypothetical protein
VEPSEGVPREHIEDLKRRYRYSEEEAVVEYHLREASNRLRALERADAEARGFPATAVSWFFRINVDPHFNAVRSLLQKRVLAREFPEG